MVSPRGDVWETSAEIPYCFWLAENLLQPIRSIFHIWVVTRHQNGIFALVFQTSLGNQWWCFLRLELHGIRFPNDGSWSFKLPFQSVDEIFCLSQLVRFGLHTQLSKTQNSLSNGAKTNWVVASILLCGLTLIYFVTFYFFHKSMYTTLYNNCRSIQGELVRCPKGLVDQFKVC